ncbi:MAG: trypsin-like peptidase domain-containing protein [Actinomycetota bacterium]
MGAGGFALGQAVDGGDNSAAVVNTVAPVAEVEAAAPSTVAPVTPAPRSEPITPGAEPAADVARIIGPSVVQVETNRGQGSGVVYADGLILTNHHVIDDASQVRIRTEDGRVIETEVLGSDPRNDIAVLSAPGSNLPIATIGSSADLEVGQLTVAIGSPFQLQQTVTAGIVSSVNRPVPNNVGGLSSMIQTDAPINPGNSGGALANRSGELVGINASIRTDGTGNSNVGIGFAVPIDTAISVAERIVSGESLEPGVLGVSGGGEDADIGVPIDEVFDGSGAESAGIQVGDRIVSIDGAPVTAITEVVGLVQSNFSGDTIEVEVLRDGERITVAATLQ